MTNPPQSYLIYRSVSEASSPSIQSKKKIGTSSSAGLIQYKRPCFEFQQEIGAMQALCLRYSCKNRSRMVYPTTKTQLT
jgi:hypothetical protein